MAVLVLWVLGAPDSEMTLVEKLLDRCGQHYVHAMKKGQRVTPSQAYRADRLQLAQMQDLLCVIFVECSAPHEHCSASAHVLDHHRPKSAGFDLPPAQALAASSLGQVMSWLSLLFGDRGGIPPLGWSELGSALVGPNAQPHPWTSGVIGTAVSGGELCCRGRWFQVPDEMRFAAASDHCLWAAYRGEVPGVDPDALFQWRIESRATSTDLAAEILKDLTHAQEYLRSQQRQRCVRYYHADGSPPTRKARSNGQSEPVVLCERAVPELYEAAAREGLAVLYPLENGAEKRWILVGARSATVQCWMDRQCAEGRVVRGAPERGYATVEM